ncbi:MAG: SCP2 sterol-binding domain-containing protein [Candidatus Lokiarchaeota archaeon]|nr:SCP2 sterol-binding domain-containing protein [Candidatus Lokiarchaeota archaeon]
MSEFDSIESCLKEIENRYNNTEKVRRKLANYNEPVQITFLDTNRSVMLLVNKDQGIEVKDNTNDENAPVKIDFSSENVMLELFNKELGAVKAYSTGKIKVVKGQIRNLMKLKSLMF